MDSCVFLLCAVYFAFRPCCSVISPKWFQNISTNIFSLPGDVNLGGLFPINQQSNNVSLISEPNSIKCERFSARVSRISCYSYFTSLQSLKDQRESQKAAVHQSDVPHRWWNSISYGATSDKFSDTLLYPSFFRTVPSDKWQLDAMVHLMNRFNWTWVAVIGSEEEYGQRGVQQFSKVAENMSVCVAYQGLIPVYTDPGPAIQTIINNIKTTQVKVVIVFALAEQAAFFFQQVSEGV
ncbi:hypothetical protein GOODEAATRI_025945 [Goodea atripinnis]|uniref:Receptor ligand binding region domain-containing protein n=1 Tax=Goodea atripinnis TaxID=208336 RepID=A0ABV0N4F1_9TELE